MNNENKSLIEFDVNLSPGRLNMDKILFLDFDGVLHPDGCDEDMEFCFMDNFVSAIKNIDPNGEIPIVISSMWRITVSLEKMKSYFPKEIARQIVGVTPDLLYENNQTYSWDTTGSQSNNYGLRQSEIEQWMDSYSPAGQWLAIDDRAKYFKIDCPDLFLVRGLYEDEGGGITEVVKNELLLRMQSWLNSQQIMNETQKF